MEGLLISWINSCVIFYLHLFYKFWSDMAWHFPHIEWHEIIIWHGKECFYGCGKRFHFAWNSCDLTKIFKNIFHPTHLFMFACSLFTFTYSCHNILWKYQLQMRLRWSGSMKELNFKDEQFAFQNKIKWNTKFDKHIYMNERRLAMRLACDTI